MDISVYFWHCRISGMVAARFVKSCQGRRLGHRLSDGLDPGKTINSVFNRCPYDDTDHTPHDRAPRLLCRKPDTHPPLLKDWIPGAGRTVTTCFIQMFYGDKPIVMIMKAEI